MIGLWSLLRPHAMLVALGLAAALAAWRWAVATERQEATQQALDQERDERQRERDRHGDELRRLEEHHLAELDRQRRLAYGLAAQRERETLAEPPTEAGAASSRHRRAAYRALLGEGTHDR